MLTERQINSFARQCPSCPSPSARNPLAMTDASPACENVPRANLERTQLKTRQLLQWGQAGFNIAGRVFGVEKLRL
jgi:hypothetical protein